LTKGGFNMWIHDKIYQSYHYKTNNAWVYIPVYYALTCMHTSSEYLESNPESATDEYFMMFKLIFKHIATQ